MGFSIGRFLGKIAGPIIGGLFGGPAGAALGSAVTAGFTGPQTVSIPSQIGPTARGFGTTGFDVTRRRVGLTGLAARGVLGTALVVGTIAELLFRARENTGRTVTRQKVVDAVKHCGIILAAEMFGLSETEICQIVISKGRRRGRGISAADMRRTRSTIRKVHNITHDLQRLRPTVRRHHK